MKYFLAQFCDCGRTLEESGTCLVCVQDAEFQASLARDRARGRMVFYMR